MVKIKKEEEIEKIIRGFLLIGNSHPESKNVIDLAKRLCEELPKSDMENAIRFHKYVEANGFMLNYKNMFVRDAQNIYSKGIELSIDDFYEEYLKTL